MVGCALLSTTLIYVTFFRRIYNFRARQLVNMRHVPFMLKFGVSASVGVGFAYDKHIKTIYEPDLYRVALKYRSYYDRDFQQELNAAASDVVLHKQA